MERCNDDQLDKLVSLISFEQKESTEEKEETQADLTHMEQKPWHTKNVRGYRISSWNQT